MAGTNFKVNILVTTEEASKGGGSGTGGAGGGGGTPVDLTPFIKTIQELRAEFSA